MNRPVLLLCAFLLVDSYCVPQDSAAGKHPPAGGTIERIQSILVPATLHAPFSATVTAEWTKVLEDGSAQIVQNRRLLVRDGAGRIYQERRRLVPKDSPREPELFRIEISDPAAHTKYFCRMESRTCDLNDYVPPAALAPDNGDEAKDEFGTLTREDLGKNIVSGIDAIGTRETRILNPGAIGNSAPLSIVKEFWYSPQLGINVSVKRIDPRHGTEIFTVTDISLAEPDPKLFNLPAGFKVADARAKTGERAAAPAHK